MSKPDPGKLPTTKPLHAGTTVLLTAGQVKTAVASLCIGVAAVVAGYFRITYKMEQIDDSLKNGWTISHQREWAHQTRIKNVGKIDVPNPDEIRQLIQGK